MNDAAYIHAIVSNDFIVLPLYDALQKADE